MPVEDSRTGLTAETLKQAFADNLFYVQGKFPAIATKNDFYMALAYTVRHRLLHHWITTVETYFKDEEPRIVCYLSAESGERYVRMAPLASVGSHAINGVAKLHSELLKRTTLRDFFEFWPEKFLDVTNGVTPRRFIVLSNPRLSALLTDKIGDGWITDLEQLRKLEPFADDPGFRSEFTKIKQANKQDLAYYIQAQTGISISPEALFDIQVKRIREYKRQHLNLLYIITLYNRIKRNPNIEIVSRAFIFGGKAAPGYFMAKLIIKFINAVGEVLNKDPDVQDRLKVVFLPDYNVKQAHLIYPAVFSSRRDNPIVAWHEVPGKKCPERSVP